MLLVHQNMGKENRYGKNFFAVLISTLRRFDLANKKVCHIHFKIPVQEMVININKEFYLPISSGDGIKQK